MVGSFVFLILHCVVVQSQNGRWGWDWLGQDEINPRNRLAYTLRSAVLAMRWIRIRDKERATNDIWSTFQTQLKRELVEDYWVAKTNGQLGDFSKKVLVAGVLGKLGENGFVQWNDWLRDIRVGYWNLFY